VLPKNKPSGNIERGSRRGRRLLTFFYQERADILLAGFLLDQYEIWNFRLFPDGMKEVRHEE
jgi:hypothetical protein